MESLTCVILHVRLEQCNVTCEQSWRWFVSSYERKIVVSVAVLSQGKRKKKNHMESYFFLSTSTKSRQNFMFERSEVRIWACRPVRQHENSSCSQEGTTGYCVLLKQELFHLFTPFFLHIISNINLPFVTSYVFQNKKII